MGTPEVKAIYFDMDGTIADLYAVDGWLPMLENHDPTPYRMARAMYDIVKFNRALRVLKAQGWHVGTVSWLSMERGDIQKALQYREDVREAKTEYILKNYPAATDEIHLVPYGTPKHEVVRFPSGLLYDDNTEVGENWRKNGGVWVNAKLTDICAHLQTLAAL